VPTGGLVGTSIKVVDSSTGTIDTRLLTATNLLTGDEHELRLVDSLFSIEDAGIYQVVLTVRNEAGSSEAERMLILAPDPGDDVVLEAWSDREPYPPESAIEAWKNTYPEGFFEVYQDVVPDSNELLTRYRVAATAGELPDLMFVTSELALDFLPLGGTTSFDTFNETVIRYLEEQDSHDLPYRF